MVITDRGKEVPKWLDFLGDHRNLSTTKGSLELETPKKDTLIAQRRQSDSSSTIRDSPTREVIVRPSTLMTRRQTRSQKELLKNKPYQPVHEPRLIASYVEYPLNALKKKITIFNEDLERLEDDQFLNDTVIEFYLTYILSYSTDKKVCPRSSSGRNERKNTHFQYFLLDQSDEEKRSWVITQ